MKQQQSSRAGKHSSGRNHFSKKEATVQDFTDSCTVADLYQANLLVFESVGTCICKNVYPRSR